eukprot:g8803.t2
MCSSEFFRDPCSLSPGCGHTFCRSCIRHLDTGQSNFPVCPKCQFPFDFGKIQISNTLTTVVEKFKSLMQLTTNQESDPIEIDPDSTHSKALVDMLHEEKPPNTRIQRKEELLRDLAEVQDEIRIIEALLANDLNKKSMEAPPSGYGLRSRVIAKRTGNQQGVALRRSQRNQSTSITKKDQIP